MWQLFPIVDCLLVLGMALLKQYIDDGELLYVALALKFLSDLCADGWDWDVQGVDLLDLGDLRSGVRY
jgi:hypothetical protein